MAVSPTQTLPVATRPSINNPYIPNQIVLPIPKHSRTTRSRVWIFGIAVPEPQLLGYFDKPEYRRIFGKNWVPDADNITRLVNVSNLLKHLVGIRSIAVDLCFPKGTGPTPEDPEGVRSVVVVSICTTHESSYMNRPPKERVDALEKLLGCGPPDWYLDTKTKDFY
ncbi:hypothetical protein H0H93_005300 [Arthromyces matolae]|nr:hypothetical protein H0H93_005300 [Arthromyces matolae]